MAKIAVLGAGSWGTALALQLCRLGHHVTLWARDGAQAQRMQQEKENKRYLAGYPFPEQLTVSAELAVSCADAALVLYVVPSHAFAKVLAESAPYVGHIPIVWAIKGFEAHTGRLLSEVFTDYFSLSHPYAILAGPSFAREVAANLPTAVTIAAQTESVAQQLAAYFHGQHFLCYTTTDIIGAQIGGAIKNVIAIATGIADGIGAGANARAALITRGLREMTRLANALGAKTHTLTGLAGLGDLALTATDNQSRNRRFGLALGKGLSPEQAKAEIQQTVEGESAIYDAYALATRLNIRMPITQHLYAMLRGQSTLDETIASLISRDIKDEHG